MCRLHYSTTLLLFYVTTFFVRIKTLSIIALLACLLVFVPATGQELVWDVDFSAVFANREGGDEMRPDQTFLFTRLQPEVGVQFVDGKDNTHRLMGGVAWYQPLNDGLEGYKVRPTLYYRGTTRSGWSFTLGAFPRHLMRHAMPRYLWSDSLNYCTPHVRGTMVQYDHDGRWLQTLVDWRQMQSRTRREAFTAMLSGGLDLGRSPLYAYAHVQYNHLAKRKDAPDGEQVNDDVTLNPMLGCRYVLGNVTGHVEAGAVIQFQRCRAEDRWRTPAGFVANATARWRWLDVEESVFAGKDLFPLYDRFGSELNLGDPYYCSKFYSRTDVRGHLFNNDLVDVSALLTFHATDRITGFWQQLSCRFFIGGTGKTVRRSANRLAP